MTGRRPPGWTGGDGDGGLDGGLDGADTAARRQLFAEGRAVPGRTRHDGRVVLEITLVNPTTTVDDITRAPVPGRRGPAAVEATRAR